MWAQAHEVFSFLVMAGLRNSRAKGKRLGAVRPGAALCPQICNPIDIRHVAAELGIGKGSAHRTVAGLPKIV